MQQARQATTRAAKLQQKLVKAKANSAWPDLLVAGILATLFFHSAAQIIKQALSDYRHASIHDAAELQTLQK